MSGDRLCWAVMIVSAIAACGFGQVDNNPPFFSSGATAYEAQVSTAETGMALSSRAGVSADRKYVNVGEQAQQLGPANFTPFSITMPAGGGYVGSSGGSTFGGSTFGGAAAGTSILDRPGMTLVAAAGG